jgi:DNA replication protein DnaC
VKISLTDSQIAEFRPRARNTKRPKQRHHEIIGDPTYADAIFDRLVHNAHRIDLAGDSL